MKQHVFRIERSFRNVLLLLAACLLFIPEAFARPKKAALKTEAASTAQITSQIILNGMALDSIAHTFGQSPAPGTSVVTAGDVVCASHVAMSASEGYGTVCATDSSPDAVLNVLKDPANITKTTKRKLRKAKSVAGIIAFPQTGEAYLSHTSGKNMLKALAGFAKNKFRAPKDGTIIKIQLNNQFMAAHKLYDKNSGQTSTFLILFDPLTKSAHVLFSGKTGWIASSYVAGQQLNQANHHASANQQEAWVDLIRATLFGGDERIVRLLQGASGTQS